MRKKPLVIIRCLTYNHESYIRQCLDGFVMQRTNFPFYAIVHDDASTDHTIDIINEYTEKYPELISLVSEKHNQYSKGPGRIREIMSGVIEKTGAKYIALCEGDDYWTDPYKLQKQVDFMETHPDFVACFHNALVVSGKHKSLFNSLYESNYPTTQDIIERRWFISTQTLMYRNINMTWPQWSGGVRNGDYMLELMLARDGRFYYMDDVMAVYRQEGQGISSVLNANKIKLYDSLISLLSKMKKEYNGVCADSFDKSIANYEHQKKAYEQDVYYDSHPVLKALRFKTYKRAIKKWLQKVVNR